MLQLALCLPKMSCAFFLAIPRPGLPRVRGRPGDRAVGGRRRGRQGGRRCPRGPVGRLKMARSATTSGNTAKGPAAAGDAHPRKRRPLTPPAYGWRNRPPTVAQPPSTTLRRIGLANPRLPRTVPPETRSNTVVPLDQVDKPILRRADHNREPAGHASSRSGDSSRKKLLCRWSVFCSW